MTMSNETVLRKAEIAVGDMTDHGGILLPAQAKQFMHMLAKESVLLSRVTMVPMKAPKQQYTKIKMADRVLRAGREAVALHPDDYAKPSFAEIELDAKLFKAETHITYETLEDNIEGGTFQQTIMQMMAEAIARDQEDLIINGDTKSADPFLKTMDGLLVQSRRHVIDAQGKAINKDLLSNLLKILPAEQKRNKNKMCFLTGINAEQDYRSTLAERATAVGDKFLEGGTPIMAFGLPIMSVPLFPENLGAHQDQTHVLLCDPKNVFVGIWRQIRVKTAEDISKGTVKVVTTMRFDVVLSEPEATAQGVNVSALAASH